MTASGSPEEKLRWIFYDFISRKSSIPPSIYTNSQPLSSQWVVMRKYRITVKQQPFLRKGDEATSHFYFNFLMSTPCVSLFKTIVSKICYARQLSFLLPYVSFFSPLCKISPNEKKRLVPCKNLRYFALKLSVDLVLGEECCCILEDAFQKRLGDIKRLGGRYAKDKKEDACKTWLRHCPAKQIL